MALSPAEKQAAYRARQAEKLKQTMDALRQQASQPHRAEPAPAPAPAPDPIGPNLGPNTPLTQEEVEHLRPHLAEFRKRRKAAAEYRAKREAEMERVRKEQPEVFARIEEAVSKRDSAKAMRDSIKEQTRPKVGGYAWLVRSHAIGIENAVIQVSIVLDGKASRVELHDGTRRAIKYTNGHWCTVDGRIYPTRKDAMGFFRNNPFCNPFSNVTVEELRKLRSKHHPDRNGDSDSDIYQLIMEELDRRRK